jgi:hypothetical protein
VAIVPTPEPPPPTASSPSQSAEEPVIVAQKPAHVELVTPLKVRRLVISWFVDVALVVDASVKSALF